MQNDQSIGSIQVNRDFCNSSYLAFRYVPKPGIGWKAGIIPEFPDASVQGQIKVRSPSEVSRQLREITGAVVAGNTVGILLSAGMDSAIIAGLMPPKTRAYTIRFEATGSVDEVAGAREVARVLDLTHFIVSVTWKDYQECMDILMRRKRAPLHPVEVGLYKAARAAAEDGITLLAVGNGADSTFGGMDKLLSKDWTFNEFVRRYTFLEPERALCQPVSVLDVYEAYRSNGGINVSGFLKRVHGLGIIQMFENAIRAGDCSLVAPFEELALDVPLDLGRIRGGEPKYILREVYQKICHGLPIPEKIPFARPMEQWLNDWQGPKRAEFPNTLRMSEFTGEQKWQLYCLERFLNLLDSNEI
jgi:asparagine synthetase B (glutamine-hydrolysing)